MGQAMGETNKGGEIMIEMKRVKDPMSQGKLTQFGAFRQLYSGLFFFLVLVFIGFASTSLAAEAVLIQDEHIRGEKKFLVSISITKQAVGSFQVRLDRKTKGFIEVNGKCVRSWVNDDGFNSSYTYPSSGEYEIVLAVDDATVKHFGLYILNRPDASIEIRDKISENDKLKRIERLIGDLSPDSKRKLLEYLKAQVK
jgi:hypothetical protein